MTKARVLIVEDNSDLRRLYAFGLNQRGYEVKLAANGAEALDRLESEKPDIILLDLFMPVMSGWDVLDRIDTFTDRIPIVVISGTTERPTESPHASIVSWLSKPVALDELCQALEEAITVPPAGAEQ
ncbi:MAG TPA: response regulator [Thermoanaerobaculia bacterium]|nr:response regulator [Thermoanaerobaculia bacterium]